jgi:CheY-like chemotaxis protein
MLPSRKKVLCVEDHPDTCELISVVLKDYEVISANGLGEAFLKFKENVFDVVLLDYHLPDGNGMELCRMIRSEDQSTPILFVTGTSNMSSEAAVAAGASGLIRKTSADFIQRLKQNVDLLAGGQAVEA